MISLKDLEAVDILFWACQIMHLHSHQNGSLFEKLTTLTHTYALPPALASPSCQNPRLMKIHGPDCLLDPSPVHKHDLWGINMNSTPPTPQPVTEIYCPSLRVPAHWESSVSGKVILVRIIRPAAVFAWMQEIGQLWYISHDWKWRNRACKQNVAESLFKQVPFYNVQIRNWKNI